MPGWSARSTDPTLKTTRHQTTHELSKEVHRIGFHFPHIVVGQVQHHYGIKIAKNGKLVTDADQRSLRQLRRRGINARDNKNIDQITINTEAKETIRDLFPNIPDNDLYQIIKTAFQKGQHKVGTADELPLVRRAQLSVVAHIRHMYTPYDRYLREIGYHDARSRVEEPTLSKLVEWRGDDENGKKVLEDVIREVVVISDDEDSEDGSVDDQLVAQKESGVEIIPVPTHYEQVNIHAIDYGISAGRSNHDTSYRSEDEAPVGYRYIQQLPRRPNVADKQMKANRRGFRRYAAWDEARRRQRDENGREQVHLPHSSRTLPSPHSPMTKVEIPYQRHTDDPIKDYGSARDVISSAGKTILEVS